MNPLNRRETLKGALSIPLLSFLPPLLSIGKKVEAEEDGWEKKYIEASSVCEPGQLTEKTIFYRDKNVVEQQYRVCDLCEKDDDRKTFVYFYKEVAYIIPLEPINSHCWGNDYEGNIDKGKQYLEDNFGKGVGLKLHFVCKELGLENVFVHTGSKLFQD